VLTGATIRPSSTSHTPLRVSPVQTERFWSTTRVYQKSLTSSPRDSPATRSSTDPPDPAARDGDPATGPHVSLTSEACPVDSPPSCAAVRRSVVSAPGTPARALAAARAPSAPNARSPTDDDIDRATPSAPDSRAIPSQMADVEPPRTSCPAVVPSTQETEAVCTYPAHDSPPAASTNARTP